MQHELITYPHPTDAMWNQEVESLIPYLTGKGIDVGCSNRSIFKDQVRLDIDEKHKPDYCCSADEIPFDDNEFDYLTAVHVFEHLPDGRKTLDEWIRVVKKGGIIAIVHPDLDHTGRQKPHEANPDKNPHNKHFKEYNLKQWLEWYNSQNFDTIKVLDCGEACVRWSFYVIMQKL